MTRPTRLEWAILSVAMLAASLWLEAHFTGFLSSFAQGALIGGGGWIMGGKVIAR